MPHIPTACYCRGTGILTAAGQVAVEDLAIGDAVITRSGEARAIKWIGQRSYLGWLAANNPNVLPVCFKKGALADGVPHTDLLVSPEHAMYLGDALIPAKLLLNGISITKATSVDEVHYYHIELDTHDVIVAEGAFSETFVDDHSRGMFQNAQDFYALYPTDAPPSAASYCAPRVEEGPVAEQQRLALLSRARRLREDGTAAPPPALLGAIDLASHSRIVGWAFDPADPETPVNAVLLDNGNVLIEFVADRSRPDLAQAGIGTGQYGFYLDLPRPLAADTRHEIVLCTASDHAPLPCPAAILEPAPGIDSGESAPAEAGGEKVAAPQRALVIDERIPVAGRDAGSAAIISHIRALRALGYDVSFVAATEIGNREGCLALAAAEGITTCGGPDYTCVEDVLCRQAGCLDLIYLHRAANAENYLALARRYCPAAHIVYSVADLHHVRLARQARLERRPDLLAFSRHMEESEIHAARRADSVITHSPPEAEALRRATGFGKVHVVRFSVAPRPRCAAFAQRTGIAIIGGYQHPPNADAVQFLLRAVLPAVWQLEPSLTCRIVGHDWRADLLRDLDPRVELVGAVDDLGTIFDQVRLTVAPLRFGSGIKGKVLESFAAGVPCAMTPVAAEGLPLTPPLLELVANDAAKLAGLVVRLHGDQAANERLGLEGAELIAREFGFEGVVEALGRAVQAKASVRSQAAG